MTGQLIQFPGSQIIGHDTPGLYDGWPPVRVLVADPPWRFRDKLPGPKRGAAKHYGCLTLPELRALPLPPLAPTAWLLLWRVAAMQAEALALAQAWGFTVKSEIVWIKATKAGRPACGLGHYVRGSHEACLIAVRGRGAPGLRRRLNVPSVFTAPRGVHSAKPAAFYELVEGLVSGPYGELFARRSRPGWLQVGDELAPPVAAPSPQQPKGAARRRRALPRE